MSKFEKVMRNKMLTDRDFIVKGSKAFVSFVRSFSEHRLSNILKLSNLQPVNLARSFFLFKVPVMREFKDLTIVEGSLSTEEELAKFAKVEYLNKNQETMIHKKIEEAIEQRSPEITQAKAN
jgi:ATP-dependent RNA helicase DDX55/SPB4